MKKNILWLFIGFIGIAAATSLSFIFEDHWVGYFASMTVAIVILILMVSKMMKPISSAGMKKIMIYLFGLLVILQVYNSIFDWKKAQFQKELLTEIRTTLDDSIGQVEAEKLLAETLREYYLSEEDSTLEEHFKEISGDRLQEDGSVLLSEMHDENDLKLYHEIPASDSIVIHVISELAKGSDPGFENRNGQTGRYEAKAILTERGVRYVRQN